MSAGQKREREAALYSSIEGTNINLCKFTIELKSIFVFECGTAGVVWKSGEVENIGKDKKSVRFHLHGDICYDIILLRFYNGFDDRRGQFLW